MNTLTNTIGITLGIILLAYYPTRILLIAHSHGWKHTLNQIKQDLKTITKNLTTNYQQDLQTLFPHKTPTNKTTNNQTTENNDQHHYTIGNSQEPLTPTQTINQYTLYLRALKDTGQPLTPEQNAHLQTHGIHHNQFFQ